MIFELGILIGVIGALLSLIGAFLLLCYLEATKPSGMLQRSANSLKTKVSGQPKVEFVPVDSPEDKIEEMLKEFDDL